MCINFSSALQEGEWVGGGEVGVRWGEKEEEKHPQVKIRSQKLPTDGPDYGQRDIILVEGRIPGQ